MDAVAQTGQKLQQALDTASHAAADAAKKVLPSYTSTQEANGDEAIATPTAAPVITTTAPVSAKMSATRKVFAAVQGHWLSACLHVMLELRVADVLLKHRGPAAAPAGAESGAEGNKSSQGMHIDEIARAVGASSPHLYKVLRVLAQYELLDEAPGQRFSANEATQELVQDTDTPSLGHLAHHLVNVPKWDAWKMLPQAVKEGKTAFVLAHGMDVYQFGELPEQAAFGEEFCKSMSFFTRHSLTGGTTSLKDAYAWGNSKVILDVGGGRGELLSTVMSWAGPDCKGVLLDVQMVIDSIDIPGMFEAKGVKGAKERLQLVVGDVRHPFPAAVKEAQVDTLMMKHFLSAFSDEDAVTIIKHCGQVLAPQGAILLLQTLVAEPGDRQHNTTEDGVAPGLFAIEILAQCPGGAWRTCTEWKALFKAAGFEMSRSTAVGCNMTLMEWRPRPVLG